MLTYNVQQGYSKSGQKSFDEQIEVIRALKPDAYVGTPSFLRIILEKARESGADISNLKRALVAAEALPPSLRACRRSTYTRTRRCGGRRRPTGSSVPAPASPR